MSHPATHFTHAVTRRPGASVTEGLRAEDRGAPERIRMLAAHVAYVATLRATGAEVIVLDALEEYPDALFVEDTALSCPRELY
jgi:dimethylargininase